MKYKIAVITFLGCMSFWGLIAQEPTAKGSSATAEQTLDWITRFVAQHEALMTVGSTDIASVNAVGISWPGGNLCDGQQHWHNEIINEPRSTEYQNCQQSLNFKDISAVVTRTTYRRDNPNQNLHFQIRVTAPISTCANVHTVYYKNSYFRGTEETHERDAYECNITGTYASFYLADGEGITNDTSENIDRLRKAIYHMAELSGANVGDSGIF